MARGTGNRCAIYERLDALDEARTVADLTKRLKPILSELAYYAITGEAAVMETREEWHSQYTDALYSATATDFNAGRAQAAAAAAPRVAPAAAARPAFTAETGAGGKSRNERRHAQAPPPPNRPPPGELPPSLRAIMDGSHPSFKEPADKP